MKALEDFFEKEVEIPRIKHGKKQTIETLIKEEASLFAKYLGDEKEELKSRMPTGVEYC